MKMEEAVGKVEELIESEVPPKPSEQETAKEEDGSVELESQVQKDGVVDSTVLSSMPCLLMELRRDSSESQLASTESDKPTTGRVYESDSSNHCMLSPSSSGHLADSDTLSSAEENEPSQAETAVEGDPSGVSGATVGRKSRRSRSESETSTMAAKKNRQSSDKQNGRVPKVKGHRSQKHKERIRLLRQKREAAARKKYNLLQDSSTSDSDLTCDSSTSSSDDDEEVSGSSKTITAEIPGHLDPGFLASDKTSAGNVPLNEEINIASSDSEVEIVGVQEHASGRVEKKFQQTPDSPQSLRCVHPRGGVIQSVSSWKHGSGTQYVSTRQTQSWTAVTPQQTWASPAEVVDLTLDEDSRQLSLQMPVQLWMTFLGLSSVFIWVGPCA
ncbi:protein C18orf25 homolog isoform X4 [Panthera uncia]|uniref:protein C18orf25 homolog isoform X4 n=1 Tax=Panthera uncia TaxID=29064 RepID=UPI0020FFDCF3|nr:protein C18orf25 homolog isoform X4 [Panthera uncia]